MNKLALLTCCAAVGLSSHTGTALAGEKPTIEGAWEIVVTLRQNGPDCSTAEIIPGGNGAANPFPTFCTATTKGLLSEYGSRASPAHRTRAPVSGDRRGNAKSDAGKYAIRYTFLTFDGSELQDARIDVRGDISLAAGGDKLTGVARYVRTDLSGNAVPFLLDNRRNADHFDAKPVAAFPHRVSTGWQQPCQLITSTQRKRCMNSK